MVVVMFVEGGHTGWGRIQGLIISGLGAYGYLSRVESD
jgi:hypothetical protein